MANGIFMGGIAKGFNQASANTVGMMKTREASKAEAQKLAFETKKQAMTLISDLEKEVVEAVKAGKGKEILKVISQLDQTGNISLLANQAGLTREQVLQNLVGKADLATTPQEAGRAKGEAAAQEATAKVKGVDEATRSLIDQARGLVSETMNTGDENAIVAAENRMVGGPVRDIRAAAGLPEITAEKPITLPAGARVISPDGRTVMQEATFAPQTTTLGPGQVVVDQTGKVIARGPEKAEQPISVPAGGVITDRSGNVLFRNQGKDTLTTLGPGQILVDQNGKKIAEGNAKNEPQWATLGNDQIKALGISPQPGMVIQQNPQTKELKVVSSGKELTLKPALNKEGVLIFATQEQMASGEVNPVPPQSLVNINLGSGKPTMTPEGALVPSGQGMAQPTKPAGKPAEPTGNVGMFPFLEAKEGLTQKARLDSLKATQETLKTIIKEIDKNPSNFGIVGTGKRVLQTGQEVVGDLGAALDGALGIDIRKGVKEAAKTLGLPSTVVEGDFNETLPKLTLWENTLAMELAKLRIQSGDDIRAVENAYKAAKKDVDMTGLFSSDDVKTRLNEIAGQFAAEEKRLGKTLSGKEKAEGKPAVSEAEQRLLDKLDKIIEGQ